MSNRKQVDVDGVVRLYGCCPIGEFIKVLQSQRPEGVKSDDWDDERAPVIERVGDDYNVQLSQDFTFVFNRLGNFIGTFNTQL